jgi:CubicO group peptidase (beta-lactamase class C family)
MLKVPILYLSLAVMALTAAGSAHGQNQATEDSALKRCLLNVAESSNFHGAAVVGNQEKIVTSFAIDREDGKTGTIDINTRFNVGSMYKMVTAVAVGQLVDKGLISFSDPVHKYLQQAPATFGKITIEQLLSHTGGTGDYLKFQNRETIEHHTTVAELLPLVYENMPTGTGAFNYSNSGYILLAAIIENVSRDSYETYTHKNILDPAGMKDTGLLPNENTTLNYTRMSMEPQSGGSAGSPRPELKLSPFRVPRGMPAGGGYSTVADLYRFARALQNHQLLKAETLKTMTSGKIQMREGLRGPIEYGFGFILRENGASFGHGGGGPGINGELRIRNDGKWIIATLTNVDPPLASITNSAIETALTDPSAEQYCFKST